MKKIPTIFKRDINNMRLVTKDINPKCQWVFDGEGIALTKLDGTCVKIEGGKFYKRREVKAEKPIPPGFIEEDYDLITHKKFGWVEIDPKNPENKYYMEAIHDNAFKEGTYELIGPKINGNPENVTEHILIKHTETNRILIPDRTFDGIKRILEPLNIEGVVFHHPDGRMGKIKKRDFGLQRTPKNTPNHCEDERGFTNSP